MKLSTIYHRPPLLLPMASSLLIVWAVSLLAFPVVRGINALEGFSPLPAEATALILLAAGGLGMWSQFSPGARAPSLLSLFLMLPQQAILFIAASAAFAASITGTYADGVVHPHGFIGADQSVLILLALWHAIALFLWHTPHTKKEEK